MNLRKKILIWTVAFATTCLLHHAHAQEHVSEITDNELSRYAMVMIKIDSLGKETRAVFDFLVKGHPLMNEGRTYLDLEKTGNNGEQVAALELPDSVLSAYNRLKVSYDSLQSGFQNVCTTIIKSDLGAGLYLKVRNGIKQDTAIAQRYQALIAGLNARPYVEPDGQTAPVGDQ